MHVLFVHPNFPAQFRSIAPRLARDVGWRCTFVTRNLEAPDVPGVERGRGFTLVELLVVIGIIVLLVSILLTAISRAREHAAATHCASNIRQIALAMAIYEADCGSYPLLYDKSWGKYVLGDDGRYTIEKCWVDALVDRRYLIGPDPANGRLGIFACPSIAADERALKPLHPGMLSRAVDYGYNFYVNLPAAEMLDPWYRNVSFHGRRGRMGQDAARKILLTETWTKGGQWDATSSKVWYEGYGWYATYPGGWSSDLGPYYHVRHLRRRAVNVAYMAGNIELLWVPPPPQPPDYAGHPMSMENFVYAP